MAIREIARSRERRGPSRCCAHQLVVTSGTRGQATLMAELLIPSHSKEPDTICGHAQRGTAQRQAGVALTCAIFAACTIIPFTCTRGTSRRKLEPASVSVPPIRDWSIVGRRTLSSEDTNRAAMLEKLGNGGPSVSRQSGAPKVSTTNLPRSCLGNVAA